VDRYSSSCWVEILTLDNCLFRHSLEPIFPDFQSLSVFSQSLLIENLLINPSRTSNVVIVLSKSKNMRLSEILCNLKGGCFIIGVIIYQAGPVRNKKSASCQGRKRLKPPGSLSASYHLNNATLYPSCCGLSTLYSGLTDGSS